MSCQVVELYEESARLTEREHWMASGSSQRPQVPQGAKTGQKKVAASNRCDESFDHRLLPHRFRRNAVGTAGAKDWVAFVVSQAKHRIEKPGVLNEFELALDFAVHAHEDQAALDAIVNVTIRNGCAIDTPPAHDAMAVGGVDHVPRVFRRGGQA